MENCREKLDLEAVEHNSEIAERARRERPADTSTSLVTICARHRTPQPVNNQQASEGGGRVVLRPTTRPGVARMSNAVHSIGYRQEKRSLIRRREAEFDFMPPSLNAMRLLLGLLFRVHAKTDHEFEEVKLSIAGLGQSIDLGYRLTHEKAEALLQELSSVVFTYRGEGEFMAAPFMAISKIDQAGIACLKLNRELKPYLLRLESRYRQLHRSVLKLRSPYSMLLYVYLRRFIGLDRLRQPVSVRDLLSAMRVDDKMPWAAFRKDYLQPAIDEITDKTELQIKYFPERGGRLDRKRGEVATVMFEVIERNQAVEADKETKSIEAPVIRPRSPVGVTT